MFDQVEHLTNDHIFNREEVKIVEKKVEKKKKEAEDLALQIT